EDEIIQIQQEKLKDNNYFCSSWALKENYEYKKKEKANYSYLYKKEVAKEAKAQFQAKKISNKVFF
ncbi:7771_t:CDS:2, partial [Gigaspora margarita]